VGGVDGLRVSSSRWARGVRSWWRLRTKPNRLSCVCALPAYVLAAAISRFVASFPIRFLGVGFHFSVFMPSVLWRLTRVVLEKRPLNWCSSSISSRSSSSGSSSNSSRKSLKSRHQQLSLQSFEMSSQHLFGFTQLPYFLSFFWLFSVLLLWLTNFQWLNSL